MALTGIIVVLFSLGASFGFCFHVGLFFADLHPAIPFLILGIGVDDMFVIVQAIGKSGKKVQKIREITFQKKSIKKCNFTRQRTVTVCLKG